VLATWANLKSRELYIHSDDERGCVWYMIVLTTYWQNGDNAYR
jgi:hypothetical protein